MEGDLLFVYREVLRQCLPPAAPYCPSEAQLPAHRRALVVSEAPPAVLMTDTTSCALDAYNMGAVPPSAITRTPELGVGGSSAMPTAPAVNLGHPAMERAMQARGHILDRVGSKASVPKVKTLLKQRSGLFLVEYQWINSAGKRDHHVIAINCMLRLVFCNTLGAIPFTLAADGRWLLRESAATHASVARRLCVKSETRVWRVLQTKRPREPIVQGGKRPKR